MKYYLIILSLATFSLSCQGQNKGQAKVDAVVDPVANEPFSIVRENMFLKLPDSIRGDQNAGNFFVQVKLNSSGQIQNFDLLKLTYTKDNSLICDISQYPGQKQQAGKQNDEFMAIISPVIKDYLYNKILFKKNKNQKIDSLNVLKFNTLFK